MKILASKEFPYFAELNDFIKMASESGLIVKWLRGCRFESKTDKKPLYEYIEVKMEMFICFIIIVVGMHILTFCVACLERRAFREMHEQNVNPVWSRVEALINPHRNFVVRNLFKHLKNKRKSPEFFFKIRKTYLDRMKLHN